MRAKRAPRSPMNDFLNFVQFLKFPCCSFPNNEFLEIGRRVRGGHRGRGMVGIGRHGRLVRQVFWAGQVFWA
jgi:hypothetical protein